MTVFLWRWLFQVRQEEVLNQEREPTVWNVKNHHHRLQEFSVIYLIHGKVNHGKFHVSILRYIRFRSVHFPRLSHSRNLIGLSSFIFVILPIFLFNFFSLGTIFKQQFNQKVFTCTNNSYHLLRLFV